MAHAPHAGQWHSYLSKMRSVTHYLPLSLKQQIEAEADQLMLLNYRHKLFTRAAGASCMHVQCFAKSKFSEAGF